MSGVRISSGHRSTESVDHGPQIHSTPRAGQAPQGTRGAGASREPGVVVDHAAPSATQQRLRQIQQRAGGSGTRVTAAATGPAGGASRAPDYNTLVQTYRNQFVAGLVPTVPPAPALPTMSGADILREIGYQPTDSAAAAYRRAVEASRHGPHSVVHAAFEHLLASRMHSAGTERAMAATGMEMLVDFGVEMLHAVTHSTFAAGVSQVMLAVAIADATSMYVQEMWQLAHGQYRPPPAILDAMRAEIPRRVEAALAQARQRAERSFAAGVRQAALGLPADPSRMGDRAYALGFERGRQYRQQHGDALNVERMHWRAFAQAQEEAHRFSPRTVAAPQHFVPVTQLEPQTIAAPIHLDGL
jgi:hypothetical protein